MEMEIMKINFIMKYYKEVSLMNTELLKSSVFDENNLAKLLQ